LNIDNNNKKKKDPRDTNDKKISNFIEKPKSGGIPAKDKIKTKNNTLKGNNTPNFFKSVRFFITRVSKKLSKTKKLNTNSVYIISIAIPEE